VGREGGREKWRGSRGVPGVEKEDPGVRRRAARFGMCGWGWWWEGACVCEFVCVRVGATRVADPAVSMWVVVCACECVVWVWCVCARVLFCAADAVAI
jgi:hypothetical protein